MQDAALRLLLPSTWRRHYHEEFRFEAGDDSSEEGEDGEELAIVDAIDDRHREALSLDSRRVRQDSQRRLSRDLEQGFRDDSDEEAPVTENHI